MAKISPRRLAALGGPPAFRDTLHVGRPNLGDRRRLLERIEGVLDSRWLTNNGPSVEEFERRIADLLGVRHCVATSNATVALEISARALELSGEVIVPSMTFVATAHALQWQGLTPVFCDVDPATHNLDPARVEALITPRTTGILGVHLWGRAYGARELEGIAKRHGLRLLFDAAHAFGCSHDGSPVGGFGDAEVFSFHATKFVNTLEGGAFVTDDDELARRVRRMKNFGFSGYDEVTSVGTNGKMDEISAAVGLVSLEGMDGFVAVNRRNHELYRERLSGVPGIRLLPYDGADRYNYQYVVLEIGGDAALDRDELIEVLWAENVLARRYFYPGCHRMEPYRSLYPDAGSRLPVTERLVERVLCLPTGTSVSPGEISVICDTIRAALSEAGRVRRSLSCRGSRRAR